LVRAAFGRIGICVSNAGAYPMVPVEGPPMGNGGGCRSCADLTPGAHRSGCRMASSHPNDRAWYSDGLNPALRRLLADQLDDLRRALHVSAGQPHEP
jgi:hypothetical protein